MVPGWGERAGGQGHRGVLRRGQGAAREGARVFGPRSRAHGGVEGWLAGFSLLPVGQWGGAGGDRRQLECVWCSGKRLGWKTGLEELLASRWDLEPGDWLRPGTHRGLGEQGELGRGEEGVGRSGRADAPSSSGSRI